MTAGGEGISWGEKLLGWVHLRCLQEHRLAACLQTYRKQAQSALLFPDFHSLKMKKNIFLSWSITQFLEVYKIGRYEWD